MIRANVRSLARNVLKRLNRSKSWQGELTKKQSYETVFEDDGVAVLFQPGEGLHCLVSFTGIGHALGGIDLQTPEFSRSQIKGPKLFIIDKQRSWGNRLNWGTLASIVERTAADRQILTLGNSMGGFLAILSAGRLGAIHTVAVVPQWSVVPEIVPFEDRWQRYVSQIDHFEYRDLSSAFDTRCRFHILSGKDSPNDYAHIELFPKNRDHLYIYLIENAGHEVAQTLKKEECLYSFISACLTGEDGEKILRSRGIAFSVL